MALALASRTTGLTGDDLVERGAAPVGDWYVVPAPPSSEQTYSALVHAAGALAAVMAAARRRPAVDRRRRAAVGPLAGAAVRHGRRPRRRRHRPARSRRCSWCPHRVEALRTAGCARVGRRRRADVVGDRRDRRLRRRRRRRRAARGQGRPRRRDRGDARQRLAAVVAAVERRRRRTSTAASRPAAHRCVPPHEVATVSIADDPVTLEEVIEAVQEALVTAEAGAASRGWDDLEREAFAHDVATSYVARRARAAIESGAHADGRRRRERRSIRRALAAYFHAGKFQALLDLDGVTDIMVNAHDAIWLQHVDGRTERYPHRDLRRRRRPARRGRPPRPPRRWHRAPLRRRQAAPRAAPARRLPARRDHERLDGAAGGDPPQRAARRLARRARASAAPSTGRCTRCSTSAMARRDAHRHLRRDRRRQDDARAGDDQRAARRHADRRHRGHPRAQPRRRPAPGRARSSSGRRARPTSRASARSTSASSSATPCASTRDWLIVGEVRDGDAAREMLLAMQHGHPSLSTVHHHSALVGVEEARPVRRPGLRGGRVPDRRPADLRRRRLLRPPRPRPPRSAGRHRGLRGRRLERRRGPAQPDLRPRPRRPGACRSPTSPTCAARSCATTASRTTCCSTPPGGGRREPVARWSARSLGAGVGARRVPRRRRLARPARPAPPHGEPRSRRLDARPPRRRASAWPSLGVALAGVVDGLGGGDGRVRAARLDGARRSSACGPAGAVSSPAPRPSPSGPRCSATCSSPTPACTRRSASRRGSRRRRSATRSRRSTCGPSAATCPRR